MPVRQRIGMLFQNYALFDFLTVGDNVAFPLVRRGGIEPDEIGRRISMFGGSASALRALEAAARCIANRLNDRRLPPVRGAA